MILDIVIFVFATATATLVWRNLKIDYPQIKQALRKMSLVGSALLCGFCATGWITLAGMFIYNPLSGIWGMSLVGAPLQPYLLFIFEWFALYGLVLLVRSVIVVLLEAGAVLKHMHSESH